MITVIYTFYGQESMLPLIKEQGLKTVIIDDCSPIPLKPIKGIDCYRITDDIHWNVTGAKNLGFHVSDGWIINSDIDHLVTKEVIDQLEAMDKDENTVYLLGREYPKGCAESDVWNVYLIHKSAYDKVGGFDEDFAGNYGYEDILFMDMCRNNLNVVERRDIKVKLMLAGEVNLSRDASVNDKLYHSKNKDKMITNKLRFRWKKLS
jgi:hypothetical protein